MAGLGPAKCQLAKPGLHPGDGSKPDARGDSDLKPDRFILNPIYQMPGLNT